MQTLNRYNHCVRGSQTLQTLSSERSLKCVRLSGLGEGPRSRSIKAPETVIYSRASGVGADTDCSSVFMKLYPRLTAAKVL